MSNEIWKDIPGFDYEISNHSRIKNKLTGKILSFKSKKWYPTVTLLKNKQRNYRLVHRLIAEAFIPNPHEYPEINHKNGIKTDCSISNLEWCSTSQNRLHAFRTGLNVHLVGFRTHSKLDELQVKTIKSCFHAGVQNRKLARYFNIHESVIAGIKSGRSWKGV